MHMIAAEAGVGHSLIHYYFGSKEKLFSGVYLLKCSFTSWNT